jgi:hypothetical protein
MIFTQKVLPRWFKQITGITGLLLALPGVLLTFGYLCATFTVVIDYQREGLIASFIACVLAILTLGTGVTLFWHSVASLNEKSSGTFQVPSIKVLVVGLVLYLTLDVIIFESNILAGLFLSPSLVVAVAIPPFVAIVWFIEKQPIDITWRRSLTIFMSSATLSLIIIVLLQMLLLFIFALLQANFIYGVDRYFDSLDNLLNPGLVQNYYTNDSIFIFIQITIILPLVVTLTKSLTIIPFIGQITRYETFLLGAISGAGYAVLESLLYIGFGIEDWVWTVIVLAIGAAIHPLGGGLIAIGWRDIITSKISKSSNWLAYAGIVSVLHIFWNLGFFALFVSNPFYISRMNLLAFVFLVGLGATSFRIGQTVAHRMYPPLRKVENISNSNQFEVENQNLAVWALSSLLAIVSVGVVAIRIVY